MKNFFKNKKILITGASGSIGKSLVLRLLKTNCNVIRAFSNDENGLHELSESIDGAYFVDLEKSMYKNKIRYVYGDVKDFEKCLEVSKDIDIIINAAAMKHVPMCEYNSVEATRVNVNGAENLVRAANINKCDLFLQISTDKVVDANSCLGATKLLAEKIVINAGSIRGSKTKFSCVRFGNVIGSRGSVLPKFIKLIKSNINLPITDKEMTRYFMTINDATDLIISSLINSNGSEIFIPKKMASFKILDLAKALLDIFKSSKSKVVYIGIRKGEKIKEELATQEELNYIRVKKNYAFINKNLKESKSFPIKNDNFNNLQLLDVNKIIFYLKKNKLV
mgnify:CR=1 FL=1|jgi:UDP-N-acetylglucosamine 4,6-dehydratase